MTKHLFIVSLRKPYSGGLFTAIQNRLVQQKNEDIVIYNLVFEDSIELRFLKKLLGIEKDDVVPLNKIDGVNYISITIKKNLLDFIFKPKKKFRKIAINLLKRHPDLETVTCHWGMLVNLPMELKKIKPSLQYSQYFHGSDLLIAPQKNKQYRRILMESFSYIDYGKCVSKGIVQTLREKYDFKGKIIYTPNGVDTQIFSYQNDEKVKKSVSFIGNLIEVKGAHLLPIVIRKTLEFDSDFKFFIVGEGYLMKEIQSQLVNYEQVIFTGRVSVQEVAQFLKKTEILMMLSTSEGFPCVVNEAKATGNFVVAPSLEGILEANGKSEGLVDASNEDELATKIVEELLRITTKKIDIQKQIKEAKAFDWERLVVQENTWLAKEKN